MTENDEDVVTNIEKIQCYNYTVPFFFSKLEVGEGIEAVNIIVSKLKPLIDAFNTINTKYLKTIPSSNTQELAASAKELVGIMELAINYPKNKMAYIAIKQRLDNFYDFHLQSICMYKLSNEKQERRYELWTSLHRSTFILGGLGIALILYFEVCLLLKTVFILLEIYLNHQN